jgi:putative PIN family toxin of toxin-antitoxin system
MKVVLDTNILLVILSRHSKYHEVLDYFAEGQFTWCVTTEILAEYVEIIERYLGKSYMEYFMEIIEQAENIEYVTTYYRWTLIKNDPDDDKFVDCAIACNAKYIVTHDKHFNVLRNTPFPKVDIVDIQAFIEDLHSQ